MKRFLRWLKDLFTSNEIQYPIEPEVTPIKPVDNKKGLKVTLALGHSATGADKGALGYNEKGVLTSEVEHNTYVMLGTQKTLAAKGIHINLAFGSSSLDAVTKANALKSEIVIQMHLNAHIGTRANNYTSPANGCECLVIKGDTKSYALAERLVSEFIKKFPNVVMRRAYDKGKKILSSGDRGVSSLVASTASQRVLFEPFFIDNRANFVSRDDHVDFLVEFIEKL